MLESKKKLKEQIAKYEAAVKSLYSAIEHGDEKHRSWLAAKILKHFGSASKHITTNQLLRVPTLNRNNYLFMNTWSKLLVKQLCFKCEPRDQLDNIVEIYGVLPDGSKSSDKLTTKELISDWRVIWLDK